MLNEADSDKREPKLMTYSFSRMCVTSTFPPEKLGLEKYVMLRLGCGRVFELFDLCLALFCAFLVLSKRISFSCSARSCGRSSLTRAYCVREFIVNLRFFVAPARVCVELRR